MPGFNCAIHCIESPILPSNISKYITDQISEDYYIINRFTLNKFSNDKILKKTKDYIIVIDGIILNKHELLLRYKCDWVTLIVKLYKELGESFYKVFRGSFSGLLFDKINNKWIFFVDHIGSKPLYYAHIGNSFFVSSEIKQVYAFLKKNSINYSLQIPSAYMLLSYGYMLEDYTLCTKIKKILPGHYIILKNNYLELKEYYFLNNTPNYTYTEDQYIDLIDKTFKKAIQLQFNKDIEYGYRHIAALSGGLDSRMTTWVAHQLGYDNLLNLTFSQTNYLDETIAKKISCDLKYDWLFKSLDNGTFLYSLDKITLITGGNISYQGIAHGYSLYENLNFDNLGIFHSGQLGDAILGTSYIKDNIQDIASSKQLLDKLSSFKFSSRYSNNEILTFYQRGFGGINGALLGEQEYTETMSPFYDIDFINLALSIPVEYRYNHRIYKKWILKKYPDAAKYIWEKTNDKITAPQICIGKYHFTYKQFIQKLSGKLLNKRYAFDSVNHMNPFAYYFRTNKELTNYINTYFEDNIHLIKDEQLKKDTTKLFLLGNAIEKIQVLSLLSALKTFF